MIPCLLAGALFVYLEQSAWWGPLLWYSWRGELGDLGACMGILIPISSLTQRCVNTKQANGLLAMWIYRNEWFNKESSRVLIRRGFLSIDRSLLMAEELPSHGLWSHLTWFRQKNLAYHLSRWVKEALIDIRTRS